jgi:hypothetical protein
MKLKLDDQAKAVAAALYQDVAYCLQLVLNDISSQPARRNFLRAFNAMFEGLGRVIRHSIVQSAEAAMLPPEWMDILNERRYEIDKTGKAVEKEARHPTSNLFAATIRAWATLEGKSCEVIQKEIFADDGWNKWTQMLRIRDRITHPKVPENMDISDEEKEICYEAMDWFFWILLDLLHIPVTEVPKSLLRDRRQ